MPACSLRPLAQVDTVGLDPRLYRTPDFSTSATADALAENELRMTEAVLTYARHAEIGQILGLSSKAVELRIARARKALLDRLGPSQ